MLTAALCLCAFAQAEEPVSLREWIDTDVTQPISEWLAEDTLITAVGMVRVEAVADVAVLSFTISAEGKTAADASRLAADGMSILNGALLAQGVSEADVSRTHCSISANTVHHNARLTDNQVTDGYTADIVVSVRLTDISLVGAVIDAAMQSGAVSAHELTFETVLADEAYRTALAGAAQQAMEKARGLAQSCGLELDGLVSVTELSAQSDEIARVEVTCRAK